MEVLGQASEAVGCVGKGAILSQKKRKRNGGEAMIATCGLEHA